MALTDAGRRLTEEHRLAQLAVGANAAIISDSLWEMLDPFDLDRSRGAWLTASLAAARLNFNQSSDIASTYVSSYQAVEVPGGNEVVLQPRFNPQKVARDLDLAGPQYIKSLVRDGMSPEQARMAAQSRMMGVSRKHSMGGGRELIDATTGQDRRAIGYRRVTDGDPCTFCALLASRGAHFGSQRAHSVYSSEQTALVQASDGGKYHLHCGCTTEIVYGHWEPSQSEQGYIGAYERAVTQLDAENLPRNQTNVLSLMRADDQAGFRDNPTRRRNSPESD